WGRGIATEAVRLVVDFGFNCLHANRIEARVYGWNPASARVLEKCGFKLEGRLRRRMLKQGERTDQLIFGLLPEDGLWHQQPPA
ncbi:MAG: putative acetyltransferase, partial [Candidatus Hydrogenedentota bacterium]